MSGGPQGTQAALGERQAPRGAGLTDRQGLVQHHPFGPVEVEAHRQRSSLRRRVGVAGEQHIDALQIGHQIARRDERLGGDLRHLPAGREGEGRLRDDGDVEVPLSSPDEGAGDRARERHHRRGRHRGVNHGRQDTTSDPRLGNG
ncbi:hypothetical protein A7982_13720 [Minicystis rosea]|nr:hypothetical protein A7982_13720 [Minicystis rosea]